MCRKGEESAITISTSLPIFQLNTKTEINIHIDNKGVIMLVLNGRLNLNMMILTSF